MEEKLYEDLKKAMKDGNTIEKNTIQLVRAEIVKKKKEKQSSLTDSEIENILVKERKNRLDAIALYEKAGRNDLMETSYKELGVINRYLPKVMSEDELKIELEQLVVELNANLKMFGQVMGIAKARFGNRADAKMMSELLKNILN